MDVTALAASKIDVRADGVEILAGVDCAVDRGEVVAVVGPNGAGKSTLLAVMAGDLLPDSGTVCIEGEGLTSLSLDELARTRAVLAQDLPSRIPFTVHDLVMLGRHPHRRDPKNSNEHDRQAVAAAITATEFEGWEGRIVATLSGGERLRAHLARVLAQSTPIVLLDEPTSALDIAHQEHTMSMCESIAAEGRAVIAVLHDLNAAARYADRIVLLDRGTVRADGRPFEVLDADMLTEVYRQPMAVIDHPHRDCPLVLVVDR